MRWVFRIVAGLALLAVLAVAAVLLLPSDRIARLIETQVEAATGARLSVAGAVSPRLWPEPGITLNDVTLAVSGTATPLATIKALHVGVEAGVLWGGEVRVRDVTLDAPVIRLVRAADGNVNWDLAVAPRPAAVADESDPATPRAAPANDQISSLILGEGRIRDGQVAFIDEATGQTWEASALDLTLRLPGDGTADAEGSFIVGGETATLSLGLADIAAVAEGKVSAITLVAATGTSNVDFEGRAGFAPMAAEGALSATLIDPAALARRFGVALATLPQGLGRDTLSLGGDMTWTGDRSLHLRNGTITADGNSLAGAFDLTTEGDRPRLTGRLVAKDLVFGGAAGAPASTGAAPATGSAATGRRGWSDAPIDASAVGLLDADLRLDADSVTFAGQIAGPVRATLAIDRARAVLTAGEIGALGGTVAGNFVVNNRDGLSMGGDLTAAGVDMADIGRRSGSDRLTGSGRGRLKFLAVGKSVDALVRSLKGEGAVNLTDGQVRGVDLARALETLDPSALGDGAVTAIDSLGASFTIAGGVLATNDLSLSGPGVSATGRGNVDLGRQTVDLAIAAGEVGTRRLRVPLLITGPWHDLDFRLDIESVAEERLKSELEERLARELDVPGATGQDLEDALRQRLEEEAAKGLGRLLGGN